MIKVKFEYDDGFGTKTSYSKECDENYLGAGNELEALNKLYLEFLMACSFPFTYKDEVIVVEEGELIECGLDCAECGCDCEYEDEDDEYTETLDLLFDFYSNLE